MVDASAEIRKLEKQLGQVDTRIATLQKQMAIPGYEEKVGCWMFHMRVMADWWGVCCFVSIHSPFTNTV